METIFGRHQLHALSQYCHGAGWRQAVSARWMAARDGREEDDRFLRRLPNEMFVPSSIQADLQMGFAHLLHVLTDGRMRWAGLGNCRFAGRLGWQSWLMLSKVRGVVRCVLLHLWPATRVRLIEISHPSTHAVFCVYQSSGTNISDSSRKQ